MTPRRQARAQTRLRQTALIVLWVLFSVLASSLVYNRLDVVWYRWLDGVPIGLTANHAIFRQSRAAIALGDLLSFATHPFEDGLHISCR